MIQLFDAHNINDFPTDLSTEIQPKVKYLLSLIKEGTTPFIRNAWAKVAAARVGDRLLPIVISSDARDDGSNYIVSPYSQYVSYAKEAIQNDNRYEKSLKRNLNMGYGALGTFLKTTRFNQVVFVNNWLLSTNLWDQVDLSLFSSLIEALTERYPKSVIVFRSVTDAIDTALFDKLIKLGLMPVVSRHVYVMDPKKGAYLKKRPFQQDSKFADKMTDFVWTDGKTAQPSEYPLISQYYRSLYLEKYSQFNPDYTPEYVRLMLESGLLRLHLLRNGDQTGTIVAVMATFEQNGVITTPFIGYDMNLPAELGLYRLMNMKLMRQAIEYNLILHQSSGAGEFKKQRGGESAYEYHFIYAKHLSWFRKSPWKLFEYLTHKVIIPNMEKYGV